MGEVEVLLVENNPTWKGDLVEDIRRACAEDAVRVIDVTGTTMNAPRRESSQRHLRIINICISESYEQANAMLGEQRAWQLVVTDIGLAEGDEHKSGKLVAEQAHEQGVPCLVVSLTLVVGIDDVSELFRVHRIYDFFNKMRFDRNRFRGHVRNILDPPAPAAPSPAGPGHSPAQPRELIIGYGEKCFTLRSDGSEFIVRPEDRALFACFAWKVKNDLAGERVDNLELNGAIDEVPSSKASRALRRRICSLNKKLDAEFGKTPSGKRWILNKNRNGYSLNTSQIRWTVDIKEMEPPGPQLPTLPVRKRSPKQERRSDSLDEIDVLLIENKAVWQDILVKDIRRACAERSVCVVALTGRAGHSYPPLRAPTEPAPLAQIIKVWTAESYEQANRLLIDRGPWRLVVTDIGLAEGDDEKSGKYVAQQSREKGAPCIVVSCSRVSGIDDVSELYREYQIYDFFDKTRFDGKRFQGHIRDILDPPSSPVPFPVGPGGDASPPRPVPQPREVRIGRPEECFILSSERFEFFVRPEHTDLFGCFTRKVEHYLAGERVDNLELNGAIGAIDEKGRNEVASDALKRAVCILNKGLLEALGPPPDGKRWIRNRDRKGYALNTARLRWTVDPKLTRKSIHPTPIGGSELDQFSDQPLPARSNRKFNINKYD
jgi:hypothetical protein